MKRRIILTALLLLLTGCQKETPELARKVPTAEEAEENETSAISSVKKIVTAQLEYSEGVGGGYATGWVSHPSQPENPNPKVGTVFRGRSSLRL